MACIRESGTGKRRRYVVTFRNEVTGKTETARLRSQDEAMWLFWRVEVSEHHQLPIAVSVDGVRRWSVQKAIWFWMGYQFRKVESRTLSHNSYKQYHKQIAALPPELLKAGIGKLTPRRLGELSLTAQKYLRIVFGLLVGHRWLTVNPVGPLPGKSGELVCMPEKKAIVAMLAAAALREKIAIVLGAVCGLRPGELVALRYCDLNREQIAIRRHITPQGERQGTKRGHGRFVAMPQELWELLDVELMGTQRPVIGGQNGRRLSLNYTRQGAMRKLLERFGIGRYYDLRHFAITNLLRRGVMLADVAKFAGHADPEVTARKYAHFMHQLPSLTGSLAEE